MPHRLDRTPAIVLAALAMLSAPLAAQTATGQFVLTRDGSDALVVTLRESADGAIGGTVSSSGGSGSVTGSRSGHALRLAITTQAGERGTMTGTLDGDRIDATIAGGGSSEQVTLTRRGVGWSDAAPAARRWQAVLLGRSVTSTERTNGGTSGGAMTERSFHFCPNGVARFYQRSSVSVYVPGASGSSTSRDSAQFRWRVIARGDETSVEMTNPKDGDIFQLGVRAEGSAIRLGVATVRVVEGARC